MTNKSILPAIVLAALAMMLSSCTTMNPAGTQTLITDDLLNFHCPPGAWTVTDGVLARQGGGDIWTNQPYGDFVLSLEFKVAEKTNSGVFIRTGDPDDCVQTGLEIQIYDSHGTDAPGKHDCGAIYDCLAPSTNAARKSGEWNQLIVTARGSRLNVVMNGEPIIEMNLDEWTEPHKNPQDDSPNKFNRPIKDFPRAGFIGFQDHGHPVWYRNVKVTTLDESSRI
ncbi:MAG: DUF1080 domain-containing protein [Sedimentisphaerales bacterium]|nr:DUF1080 domain-containing protein [Sedimentisphaerales bacterium]